MTGITGYGLYVPYLRIERSAIAKAWERTAIKGCRSVANNDEDSVTLAVEAVRGCLHGKSRKAVEGLYFATTTAPYAEKSSAELIAAACNLDTDVSLADFGNTLRGGVRALRLALDAAAQNKSTELLVAAADCRVGYPRSDSEQLFGDAAAAISVGQTGVLATVEHACCVNGDLIDVWRNENERFVNLAESRLASEEGYLKYMTQAVTVLMKRSGHKPSDFTRVIFTSGDLKECATLAKKLGFDPRKQMQDSYVLDIGNCGTAQPLFLLAAALETAQPGDLMLLAAYGNGADAMVLRVTDEIAGYRPYRSILHYLTHKKMLDSYAKYLSYRELVAVQKGEPFRLFPSNAAYHRDYDGIVRFHGSKCRVCGESCFPANRICPQCGSKDEYDAVPCAEKTAKVYTFTIDYLAGRSDDPMVVQAVLESDDGIRFYQNMTDCDPEEVAIGLNSEFTFRKIYVGADYINYYWKCRPVREEATEQ